MENMFEHESVTAEMATCSGKSCYDSCTNGCTGTCNAGCSGNNSCMLL